MINILVFSCSKKYFHSYW